MKKFDSRNKKRVAERVITAILAFVMILASATAVYAADTVVKNEKAQMDFTDSNTTGTVKINITADTAKTAWDAKENKILKKIKVSIEKGDMKYNYDLNSKGDVESFPLQWGNGEYSIKVMVQASDPNKYSVALTNKITLALKDEKAPYMNSNQLVNYTKDSAVVKKAAELTKNCKTEIEKVEAVYKFVIDSLEYDTKKASDVQSGYLPDVDKIVNSGKGICFDYAAVLAAMLRSQGIPAKLVMGWVKVPESKDPVYHAWNEFYLKDKGWFKVNEMKFDGKKFERVDPTFDSSNNSNKAVIKFIGDGSNYAKSYEF